MARAVAPAGWLLIALWGCSPRNAQDVAPVPVTGAAFAVDTSGLVPPGYGLLRQDDVALRLQQLGMTVRLIPLDESVLRVLSSDSYRTLRDLRESRRDAVASIARRTSQRAPSLWYVSFHNQEQGEARFSPTSIVITNVGRDFRPLDVVALTAGFGAQRLAQRESQSAILVFDETLDVKQPLVVTYEGARSAEWNDRLQRIERERALIRSRLSR